MPVWAKTPSPLVAVVTKLAELVSIFNPAPPVRELDVAYIVELDVAALSI